MAEKGRRAIRWLSRWGFAALVALGAAVATWMAATVAVPADVPGFALQAAAVYRLEIGGAFFAGLYLASTALVLALNNRAFTEVGTAVIRAHGIDDDLRSRPGEGALRSELKRAQVEIREMQKGDG